MGKQLPPHDEAAERALLGSLIIEFDRVMDLCIKKSVHSDQFYIPAHRILYETMVAHHRFKRPLDIVTLGEYMKRTGTLESVGGYAFLESLIDNTWTTAHSGYYIELVQQYAVKRLWLTTGTELIDKIYGNTDLDDLDEFVTEQQRQISKLHKSEVATTSHIKASIDLLKDRIKLKAPVIRKLPSGINTLRQRIVGYPVGRMTVIASRPGVGKTSLACSEVLNFAKRNIPSSILTFEMTKEEYTARLSCIHADVDLEKYIDGKLDEEELNALDKALDDISKMPIRITHPTGMNIKQVLQWMEEEKSKSEALVIDYFLKIRHLSKKGQRESSIYGDWSRELSRAALNCDSALLLLTQLKRFSLRDKNGCPLPPTKDDLKETGCLEEDAYLLLLLHNHPIQNVSNYQLIVDKHRSGWSGIVPVQFVSKNAHVTGIGGTA